MRVVPGLVAFSWHQRSALQSTLLHPPGLLAFLLLATSSFGTSAAEDHLLNGLKRWDTWEFPVGGGTENTNRGFIATFLMLGSGPGDTAQGVPIHRCNLLWARGFFALTFDTTYPHDPVYLPPPAPGIGSPATLGDLDHDRQKNLLLWRSLRKCCIFSAQRNEQREEFARYVIKPNGEVFTTNLNTCVTKFIIGERDSLPWFNLFRHGLGRGYGECLDRVILLKQQQPSTNLTTLEAFGSYGKGFPKGRWSLTFEPESDNLVRSATFTPEGHAKPAMVAITSGVVGCSGLRMAASGRIQLTPLQFELQLLTLTNLFTSEEAFRLRCSQVADLLDASLPIGSEIIDFRGPTTKKIRK
jgi:hypothetical protein